MSHAWYTVYQRHVTPILQVFQSDLGGVLCLNLTSKPCLPDRNTCKKRSPTSNAEKQAVISVKVFSKIIAHFWISGSEISKRTRQKGKDCNMYLKTTSTALPVTGVMTMKMNFQMEARAYRSQCKSQPPHCTIHVLDKHNKQTKSTRLVWERGQKYNTTL